MLFAAPDDQQVRTVVYSKNIIANPVAGTHFTVSGLPANLEIGFTAISTTTFSIWIVKSATSHANIDDTTFTITFDKSIFATPPASNDDIIGRVQTFKLDFVD